VVTTTLPITNFTKAVAGDRVEVTYLLPTNVGPHDYQARPEDARTIAEADVLVTNGLGVEAYLSDLVANANNQNLKIVDTSQGVQTIPSQAVAGHEHAAGEGHPAGEEHAEETGAGGHEHEGEFNPHIWLDPIRAIQQVENILDGLIAADPKGKDTYTANAATYIDKLKALNAEFTTALKPYAGKEFVTYHDFALYFAQRYNLKAEYLVGVPEENPAPGDVKRVIDAAQASDLKTLLTEPQAGEGAFSTLSKDLNVQVSTFDPMETSGPEGVQPDYYLSVMRQNVKSLQTTFSGQSTQSQLPIWSPARAFAVVVKQPMIIGLGW
jgi:zinc/manganese transport system substrate-binding protein